MLLPTPFSYSEPEYIESAITIYKLCFLNQYLSACTTKLPLRKSKTLNSQAFYHKVL